MKSFTAKPLPTGSLVGCIIVGLRTPYLYTEGGELVSLRASDGYLVCDKYIEEEVRRHCIAGRWAYIGKFDEVFQPTGSSDSVVVDI